jgi:methylenetetrahydrofolate dehydrogenase (NADP+) / methenyltetrahydrofolate cyclohydrolase
MNLLDGKMVASKIKSRVKSQISEMDLTPGLGIIIVGDRKDSLTYVNMKKRTCASLGVYVKEMCLEEHISQEELLDKLYDLNKDPKIHGILVQLPLPKHINQATILSLIKLDKDVEGFHPVNVGLLTQNKLSKCCVPCTPLGCITLLDEYGISLKGKHVVVVGKSDVVGLPISLLCLHREATVTICHIHTKDLISQTRLADVLIVACGKPKLITKEHVKEGVVVLDIGINHIKTDSFDNNSQKYKIVGDVDFEEVSKKASLITPVPGGVGPMTIATLMSNIVQLTKVKNDALNRKINEQFSNF